MLFTREWVAEKYTYYNDLIWDGELPPFNEIEFKIFNAKNPWGRGGCKQWVKDSYGIPHARRGCLELSNYYDAPEWVRINTLVHEMCHIYERFCEPKYILDAVLYNRYTHHYPRHGHGTVFYEQARRVESLTDIKIQRYVNQDEMASSCVSERNIERFKGKMSENGGSVEMFLLVTVPYKNRGFRYAYVKPTPEGKQKWEKFLSDKGSREYFKAAVYCIATNPEVGALPTRRSVTWSLINDVEEFMNKYDIQIKSVIYGDASSLGFEGGNDEFGGSVIGAKPERDVEKRYKLFTIKFTSGRIIQYRNVTKREIKARLRQDFPKFPDSTIETLVNNDKYYTESVMKDDKNLDFLVEKAVRRGLDKFTHKEDVSIRPFSDEDMDKLQMLSIVED